MILDQIKDQIKSYFNVTPYLGDEAEAKESIIDGVSFRGPNIIILIFAIFIASLGLNTNSTAVIIGAMLISPLMGPIIGIGLGVGTYDFALIKRSARNLAAAALFSVIASTIYFFISPVSEGHSELLARTSPTIYDVIIGFFGGAAGILALRCKQKGNVIPGVAIATALLPPLCTAGYGLATFQFQYFTGALYLFVINSIFIALATLIGVKLMKFKEVNFVDPGRRKRIKRTVTLVVIATLLPSIYLTVRMLQESFFVNDASAFVDEQLNLPNTQVFSKKAYVKGWKKHLDITLIGQAVNIDSLHTALMAQLNEKTMLKGTILNIKQGFSTSLASNQPNQTMGDLFTTVIQEIDRQKSDIDSLRNVIHLRDNFDSLSYTIAPEIKVLYPTITNIALSRNLVCNTQTRHIDTVNVAIIEHQKPLKDLPIIKEYIETRTGLKDLQIIQANIMPKKNNGEK